MTHQSHEDVHPDAQEEFRLYEALLVSRVIEERMLILLRQNQVSKWFSGIGQEAVSVGAVSALNADDYVLPMHRNLGVFTTRNVDRLRLFRQLLGRQDGFTEGRDRSFHFMDMEHHIVGMISHLGAMLPVACGLALAAQLSESKQVALAFFGDGASSEGDVHEACNLAAVWSLPVIFLLENNQYGLSTPTSEQYRCARLVDRAVGYGMMGVSVDGNDVLAVREAVRAAAERARAGEGPTLIECQTFRMRGHEEASGTDYVPSALFEQWRLRDPIHTLRTRLISERRISEEVFTQLRALWTERIRHETDEAVRTPRPISTPAREEAAVYAATASICAEETSLLEETRYIDAISDGLRLQMKRDARTILIGQDIASYGGVFKVTDGFVDQFGPERVRNTPIIESGALGTALGLALAGYRPMVEMQFADFIACGFNQIVNNLSKTHYRTGIQIPVVIRAPHGGGVGAGPFHSQSVEGWFTSTPGLKVVAPATPHDAKGLLLSAFADPNPVLFLEHKRLYRSVKGPVPTGFVAEPIGQAKIIRSGTAATIVTYGVGVHWALEIADAFADRGVDIEVLDLRTLVPWDVDTVCGSVRKTGRLLIVHEAPIGGGFGGEIAATVGTHAFEWLDAPIRRCGALDTPVPFAPSLEVIHSPKARLLSEMEALLDY